MYIHVLCFSLGYGLWGNISAKGQLKLYAATTIQNDLM